MTQLTFDDRGPTGRGSHSSGAALALAVTAVLAGGCGSGGDPTGTVPTIDVHAHGRVALAALGGASVEVYRVGAYGAPVATATTSAGPDLASTGNFTFTLTDVSADAMFLLVATGGQAHDVNEDGVPDGPTPNAGKVHALASAADLVARDVRLSAVTEVVYQRVRYFLEALYDDAYVAKACDSWTTFVLRASVDGDAAIGRTDALAFDPRLHAAATFRRYAWTFASFVERLLAGEPVTTAAMDLSREEFHYEDIVGETSGIDLVGNVAYVTRGYGGLDVWNVADPTAPVILGHLDTPGYATNIQVVGTRAYVAAGTGGLLIVDVSVPGAPSLARVVPTLGNVEDVHVVGNRAYLCGGESPDQTLWVADVTTPATAALLGDCPMATVSGNVRAAGNFAYVGQDGQIETFDVSNPTQPVSVGTVSTLGSGRLDLASGHLIYASFIYLEAFSLATPAVPQQVAAQRLPGFGCYGMRAHGTQAILLTYSDGLALFDLADPAAPVFTGLLPVPGSVYDLDRDGGLITAVDGNGGFHTIAAGTPAPSGVVAALPRGNGMNALEVVGDRIYVATYGPDELAVLDASNPLAPTVLGSVPLAGETAYDLALTGNVALVGEYNGLFAYDVGNAAAPAFLGGNTEMGVVGNVAVADGVAYVTAQDDNYLGVYDVSDPTNVDLLDSRQLLAQGRDLAVDGNVLLLACGHDGFLTFDLTNPRAPAPAGHLGIAYAQGVAFAPPNAFVSQLSLSGFGNGLRAVDCSDLSAPTSPGTAVVSRVVERVALAGQRAYVSTGAGGVQVVDISNPAAPTFTAEIPVPGQIADLDVEGGYVFAALRLPQGALVVLRAAQVAVP